MVCLRAMQLYIFQNMEGNLNNSYSLQTIYTLHEPYIYVITIYNCV